MSMFTMLRPSMTPKGDRTSSVLEALGFDADFVDAIVGDLAEEFAERAGRDGAARARLWYARELLRSTPHMLAAAVRRGGRGARMVIAASLGAALLMLTATVAFVILRDGPPVRLVSDAADEADVVLVNRMRPIKLPMRVLDERGHTLDKQAVRYSWAAGAPIAVSPTGVMKCTQPGDALVRASLGAVVTQLVVHCRPVKEVRASSWVDLIHGGDARELPVVAIGMDDQPVTELRGEARITDTSIAVLNGMMVRPRSIGATMMNVDVGDNRWTMRVIVHERVTSFTGLRDDQRYIAIPMRLAQGDTIHLPIPPGDFWLKYLPLHAGEGPPTIVLRGPASCSPGNGLRVYVLPSDVFGNYCAAAAGATVVVAHGRRGPAVVEGFLAMDRVNIR